MSASLQVFEDAVDRPCAHRFQVEAGILGCGDVNEGTAITRQGAVLCVVAALHGEAPLSVTRSFSVLFVCCGAAALMLAVVGL